VLKVLYQVEVARLPLAEVLETSFEEVRATPEDRRYVEETVAGVLGETERLDAIISELAEGWRLDRLAKIDKNVLRAAIYELDLLREQPSGVIINDAVEIAKKYSTDDSGRFVNGILGNYVRRRDEAAVAVAAGKKPAAEPGAGER
jgi:N utilization substance protein B